MRESKLVEVKCKIKIATTEAYLVNNGVVEEWIPTWMVKDDIREGKDPLSITRIFIEDWFAMEKGFI